MCACNLQQALAVLTPRKHASALCERYEAATATAAGAWGAGVPRAADARFEPSATNTWPAAFPLPDGAGERRDLYSSSSLPYAGLKGEVWGSEGTGRVFTTNMGASSGLGSLYAGRSDYASSNSGHFGEKADKGYPKGYRTARADYAASYGSSPPSRYGAGMLHPHGNRLPDDLARLLADAAAYRKHH